jgi:hypothetical protein
MYKINEEEDIEDIVFKEKPQSLPWSQASLKKRKIIIQKHIICQEWTLKYI